MKMKRLDTITALMLETFRLNGRLLAAGDALVADMGVTSSRWQVLGAIALSPAPIPVAHIARNMGLTRQAVQRLVDAMAGDGLLRFGANPHHRRAKLVLLTAKGEATYRSIMKRYEPWALAVADGLQTERIAQAAELLRLLQLRLGARHEEVDANAE